MTLFHRTTEGIGALILREGFLGRKGRFTSDFTDAGVWFSDRPSSSVERNFGGAVLSVELRGSARSLSAFERLEGQEGYREWLIPLALVKEKLVEMHLC